MRDECGLATGFETEGDFPKYGNDDDRADEIGVWLLRTFLEMIKKRHTYRNSEATTSILTITSNVVYGKVHRRSARRPCRLHPVCSRCKPQLRRRAERPAGFP